MFVLESPQNINLASFKQILEVKLNLIFIYNFICYFDYIFFYIN